MRQPKKSRKAKTWIFFIFGAAILFIFRKSVFLAVVKIALSYSLSGKHSSFTYDKMQWEDDAIRINAVHFVNTDAEILIEEAAIALSGTLFSWKVHCKIFHPQIIVKANGASHSAPLHFLFAPHFPQISWEVYDGVVQLDENPPLYFSFLPDDEEHRLGKIALSYEPQSQSPPLFTAVLEEKENALKIDFSLIEEDCSRLVPIALALFPQFPKEWEQTQGKVESTGTIGIDQEGNLTELSCQWQIDNLALESRSNGIELRADFLSGAYASDSIMSLHQGKGKMECKEAKFQWASLLPYVFNLENGQIVFEPDAEPSAHLIGSCEYAGAILPFAIHAEGELHADDSFLLKLEGMAGREGALFTLADRISVEREVLAVATFDEGIASAIFEEKDATDRRLAAGRKLTEKVNEAQKGSVQLSGSICRFEEKKYAVELHFKDLLFEHLAFFSPHVPFSFPKECWMEGATEGQVILLYENEEVQIDSEMAFGEEKWIAGALFDRGWQLKEGWFETENATERTYGPFLKFFEPDLLFTGEVKLKGNFDPSYFVLLMQGSDCRLHHSYGDLVFPTFGETGVELIYDRKEKKLKGEIPLQDAKWSSAEGNIDSLNAVLQLDGDTLHIPSYSAVYQEIALQGSIDSLSLDRTSPKLHIEKAKIKWAIQGAGHGSMHDNIPLALEIPSCDIEYGQDPQCSFHLFFDRDQKRVLELAGSAQRKPEERWEIAFDRQRTLFLDTALNISGLHVSKEHLIALDMHPVLSCDELFSHLTWLSEIGLFSIPVESLRQIPCEGMLQTSFSTPDLNSLIRFKIDSKDIAYEGKKIAPFHLSGQYLKERIEIENCSGDGFAFKAQCSLLEHSVHLSDLEGQIKGVFLKASADVDLITRDFRISLDSVKANTAVFAAPDKISGSFAAHGTMQGSLNTPLRFNGDAICTFDLVKPLGITAWNVKPLKISYAYDSGLCIEELSAYLKSKKEGIVLGVFSCDQCRIPSLFDAFYATDCRCSVDPLILKECADAHLLPDILNSIACPSKLEASGDLQWGREGFICHAALKEGTYGIKDTTLALQKVGLQCQRGVFTLQAKTKVGEQPLWGALSVALTKNPQAILRITDDPQAEGIRVYLRSIDDQLCWEKIQGTCLGLDCSLAKSSAKKYSGASVLTGRIAIDASRLPTLLSPSLSDKFTAYKPGKGYAWQGDLILWQDVRRGFQMTGEITGKDWELLGYRFKELRLNIDAHPTHILLSNIHVEDEAGIIAIKKVEIEKKEHWELSIPIVSIREWHPSSMRKIDAPVLGTKPFLIRNFTLSSIHADLEKFESLEGRGKLTFTNHCKKESTLLDTPIEMIKNFGLDPGLLTPVQGEIDIDLKGDKMYLVSLKDVFSEAKRSEFYLAPGRDLSFIDLDGKMHIDLKMRQDVTLKITEPFTLTIRGTLENPRYGLDLLP